MRGKRQNRGSVWSIVDYWGIREIGFLVCESRFLPDGPLAFVPHWDGTPQSRGQALKTARMILDGTIHPYGICKPPLDLWHGMAIGPKGEVTAAMQSAMVDVIARYVNGYRAFAIDAKGKQTGEGKILDIPIPTPTSTAKRTASTSTAKAKAKIGGKRSTASTAKGNRKVSA